MVDISDLLEVRFPALVDGLRHILTEHDIPLRAIHGTKDIRCRDYLPVQVEPGAFVRFQSAPDYLEGYEELITVASDPGLIPRNPKSYMTGHDGWFRRVFQEGADFWSVAVEARLYERMRNWLVGTRIVHETGRRFVPVNLVRSESEIEIEDRFGRHIVQDERRHFRPLTWEQVVGDLASGRAGNRDVDRLVWYFDGKSLGYARTWVRGGEVGVLRRAFGAPDLCGLARDPTREGLWNTTHHARTTLLAPAGPSPSATSTAARRRSARCWTPSTPSPTTGSSYWVT
jgi:hypothetical protein